MVVAEEKRKIRIKTFTFSLSTPYGNLSPLSIEVPDIPMRLSEVVPLLFELCNKCVEMACEHLKPEEKVTCSKGCGICCRQVVPVSVPEAMFLHSYLDRLPTERREHFQSRLKTIADSSRRNGILPALENAGSDHEAIAAAEAYFNQGYECPFLEEGVCSIHAVRPFACREFNAVSDPELCENPFENRVRKVPVVPKMTSVAARFAAKMLAERPVLLPLITLYAVVEVQSEAENHFPGIRLFETLLDSFAAETVSDN